MPDQCGLAQWLQGRCSLSCGRLEYAALRLRQRLIKLARAKTGRGAIDTLSPRADRVLTAYLEATVSDGIGDATIFRNRSGRAYSKDTLSDDFRDIRARVFGADERRQMADFRRTRNVEALAGGIDPETLSSKMANSLSPSAQSPPPQPAAASASPAGDRPVLALLPPNSGPPTAGTSAR